MTWEPGQPAPEKATNSVEYLRSLFRYDPSTGILYREERPVGNNTNGRLYVTVNQRNYLVHRIAWIIFHGRLLEKHIDHINGNPLDNRIENLREVTRAENCRNIKRARNNTSGVTGVHWQTRTKCWVAQIRVNNTYFHLGYFKAKDDAIAARKAAELRHDFHPNHGKVRGEIRP